MNSKTVKTRLQRSFILDKFKASIVNIMSENPFHIGLCMAGAVSAGAYTAGVVDYVIKSLDRWEQSRGQPGVPTHRVQISIIGGASAGGMTGLLTAAVMHQLKADLLYKSWVTMQADNMMEKLFSCTDFNTKLPTASLLNGAFANEIADSAFSNQGLLWNDTPPYFHPQLKVFTTLTNVSGFPYNISFNTDLAAQHHAMSVHYDYACFQAATAPKCINGWMPLNIRTGLNAQLAKDAAIATGAFPLGLPAKQLTRPLEAIVENKLIYREGLMIDHAKPTYESLHVDGGLMNNEPFEKVRELLNELVFTETQESNAFNRFDQFRSTVLMIDPFPENIPNQITYPLSIGQLAGSILHAMMQQMKAKPAPIADVLSKNKAGQFLIAPVRYSMDEMNTRIEGSKAIACGAIGGFGGFISKDFRAHDYALEQYNCEMFLRNHFTIPIQHLAHHPIFSKGYEGVNHSLFESNQTESVQIIPQFGTVQKPLPWPTLEQNPLVQMRPIIQKRVAMLLNSIQLTGWRKVLLQLSGDVFLNRMIANQVRNYIQRQLKKHDLLK
jgi:predicted acylesterase/phospholipase RssA